MTNINLFFILYDPRSGSTLLSNLITKNMNVLVSPETHLLINILLEHDIHHVLSRSDCLNILKIVHNDRKINDWEITEKIVNVVESASGGTTSKLVKDILSVYLDSVVDFKYTALGLKKDTYIIVADKLKSIFPSAKFICIVRDPRGVFLSKKKSIYTGNGKAFQTNAIKASKEWNRYTKCINIIKNMYFSNVLLIRYEDIIADEHKVISKIASFLSISMSTHSRNYSIHDRYKDIHTNVHSRIIRDNDKKWMKELSEKEIYYIQLSCSQGMKNFGYRKETYLHNRMRFIYFITYTIQSFLLNIVYFLRRRFGSIKYKNMQCFASVRNKSYMYRLYSIYKK